MPNITWCDLPTDVSLWPGLPLSLSGDEVMPLDYHAGRSGWLLYGRGLDKQRLTQYQSMLGAAMVIVAAWCVEDYQVIRLAGSLTQRATRLAHDAGLDVAPLGKIPHLKTPGLLVMDMDSTAIQIECIDENCEAGGQRRAGSGSDRTCDARRAGFYRQPASARGNPEGGGRQHSAPGARCAAADAGADAAGAEARNARLEGGHRLGGFTFFADYLRDKLRLTTVVANELETPRRQADRPGDWRRCGRPI